MNELEVKRAARREANLRTVNERVAEAIEALDVNARVFTVLCECGVTSCVETFDVPSDRFESVHVHAKRFFVLPDHVLAEIERVVEQGESWVVVEKFGRAGHVVERA